MRSLAEHLSRVRALAACSALLLLACSDASAPPTPPDPGKPAARPQTRITPDGDSLTSVHATVQLMATRSDGAPATFTWTSTDTTVADVSQAGRVRARRDGVTAIVATSAGAGADTARIVVRQQVATVALTPGSAAHPLHHPLRFVATALDAGGAPVPDTRFVWTTANAERATVDTTGLVTPRALGIDTVRASANGVVGAAALAIVPAPMARFHAETLVVGAGQTMTGELGAPPKAFLTLVAGDESVDLMATSSDATVGDVAVGETEVGADESGTSTLTRSLTVTGHRPGTALLAAAALRYRTGTAVLRVTTPRLLAGGRLDGQVVPAARRLTPGFTARLTADTGDSLGIVHRVLADLAVTARSSDAAVVRVEQATAVVEAGGSAASFSITPLANGRTTLVFSAPGYRPDTVPIEVARDGPRFTSSLIADLRVATIGAGLKDDVGSVIVEPPAGAPAATEVTLTQRRPDLLRVPPRVTPNSAFGGLRVALAGLSPGMDTIVASMPGYASDTLVVHVTRPTFVSSADPSEETTDSSWMLRLNDRPSLRLYPADSTGRRFMLGVPSVGVRVTSTDPAVLRPESASVRLEPTGVHEDFAYVPIEILSVGRAALRFEAEDGNYITYTTPTFTVVRNRLTLGAPDGISGKLTLGLGQSTGAEGLSAHLDYQTEGAAVVYFRSTDPRIVLPRSDSASAEGDFPAYAELVAGDVTGSAWIVASGVGLEPDSVLVEVGRPRFAFVRQSGNADTTGGFTVRLLDHAGKAHTVVEPLEITLGTSDSTVIGFSRPTVTFHPGAVESDPIPWIARRAGSASLIVHDARTPARYDPEATAKLTVKP